jgi:hypothetical protein
LLAAKVALRNVLAERGITPPDILGDHRLKGIPVAGPFVPRDVSGLVSSVVQADPARAAGNGSVAAERLDQSNWKDGFGSRSVSVLKTMIDFEPLPITTLCFWLKALDALAAAHKA